MRFWIIALALVGLTACGGPSAADKEKLAATQAVIDERVKSGQMTEAEGRLAVAKVKADIDAERRRNYAIMTGGGGGGAVYQPVGGGTVIKY